jgi:hypothetical protein
MIGIRKRSLGAESLQHMDRRLCGTESFHVTFGCVDVCTVGHVDVDVRKVRGLAEGGETSTRCRRHLRRLF